MNLRRFIVAAGSATAITIAGAAAAQPSSKIALTNARIIPVVGPEIPQGTILLDGGVIAAVGADVEIPFDAMEVDLSGRVVMPGLIDPHSWRGLDRANESLPVTPFLDVADAIDPSRLYFEDALRDGITSIHVSQGNNTVIGGVTRVVRPIGLTPDEMTVEPMVALKMSVSPKGGFDRMRQMATMRGAFDDLDHRIERLAEKKYEESLEERGEKIDVGPEEARERGRELIRDTDYDDMSANLVLLRRGDLDAWIYCGAAMDVAHAIAIAERQGFLDQTVFVLGPEAFKASGELKQAGRPVVLPADLTYRERDPITGEIEETFIPRVIHDAGLKFALVPNPDDSMAERYLNYQAAILVRNGLSRQTALESVTINPATMIGMEDQVGSLEEGKRANIVVMSGDPLDFSSWVDYVYIDGVLAYDRSNDPRLQELLKLAAMNAEESAADEQESGPNAESEADSDAGNAEDASSSSEDSNGTEEGEGE